MMRSLSLPSKRRATSCSVLALATVLVVGATPAAAQSFLGTGTVTNGTGTITTGVNTTNIAVTTPQTVIDWVPFDNAIANNTAIAFQNAGTTASFSGPISYAVLNRINPADSTRNILLNGIIQTVAAGAGGGGNGSIYFYSPGGFVIGANAVINVGSLVLSASPITVTSGNFIGGFGTTNTVTFGQAGQAGAAIATIAGSAITANGGDAYVAMVAPRVQHGGNINVSGSAALVGAEAATINFSPDGLFDIQVTAGSTDANGVYNDGNITGSASAGAGDIHRAYLVAVPKNAAMTMLITTGSDLGFDVAGAANVVGNTVVLSAGHDIVNGSISGVSAGSTGAAIANLDVRDSTFTSAMIGEATGYAHLAGYAALKFYSNVAVHADGEVWLSTQLPGGSVDIDGSLSLSTEQFGNNVGEDITSSGIQIFNLNGGTINVDGATTLDTDAWGGFSGVAGVNGGDATAGNINVMANGGGSIALLGGLTTWSDGRGGGVFAAGVDGGVGTGGQVLLRTAGAGSTLTVNNGVAISANGYGGSGSGGECFSCDGDGGDGQGGDIRIVGQSGAGSTLTITGNVSAVAAGFGGSAQGASALAGDGFGGNADFFVGTSNVMTLTGNLLLQASGTGGSHAVAKGGEGHGGQVDISEEAGGTSGSIAITGNVELASDGLGGASFGTGSTGGDGYGGSVNDGAFIFSEDATITINGSVDVHSAGNGGAALSGIGGIGFGGDSQITSDGLLTINGNLFVTANATGGNGSTGGDAFAGDILVRTILGGDIELGNELALLRANAQGGDGTSGNGGDAFGGDINVYATGAGSTIAISGPTAVESIATGGNSNGAVGGYAEGGDIVVYAESSGSLQFDSGLTVSANATGGASATGGGNAQGGEALLQASAGSTVSVGGDAIVNTNAFGGSSYDFSDGVGGNAIGGTSRIQAFAGTGTAGTIDIDGSASISANGVGGTSYSYIDGAGGNGTGGTAQLYASPGTITIGTVQNGGGASLSADGYGGDAANGNGGDGTGGNLAEIWVQNGDITIEGFASVSASGFGGDGLFGGNGLGSGDPSELAGGAGGAHIFAQNGDIVINGGAGVWATGTGGDGGLDNNGYNGDDGGDGGDGTGGWATIYSANSNLGPSSISIVGGSYETSGYAEVEVWGRGGDGGDGSGGFVGGDGGNGGDGIGGSGSITAAAGNATVSIGSAHIDTQGNGGDGGDGGNVDGAAGGNGGDGGDAFGGYGTIGTQSGSGQSTAVNLGFGDYGFINMDSAATGGMGGDGGFGSTSGDGGNGGDATGGAALLLVRGSRVDAGTVWLNADAYAGDGGLGDGETSVDGNGGNASVGAPGGIGVLVTDRYLIPAHRGTLNAGSILGSAVATGGNGTIDGSSQNFGGSQFTFRSADGNIGSVDFLVSADSQGPDAANESISVIDGDVIVDDSFSFITSGNLSLFLDNASFTAGAITWHAADFVPDAANGTPGDPGTFFGNSFDIQTGNNFLTTAHLDSVDTLTVVAPGLISVNDITVDADLYLEAQGGGITANDLDVAGAIDLNAFGGISLNIVQAGFFHADAGSFFTSGNITSESNIQINTGDDVTLGNLIAGQTADINSNKAIRIISGGSVLVENINSIGGIDITAAGSVVGENVTTGDVLFTDALGAIQYDNISAGLVNPQPPNEPFSVGLISGVSITVDDIDASLGIGFATLGTLTSGNLTTGGDVLGLVDGNMSFGVIDAGGRVLLADYSMYTNAGGTIPTSDNFDPELVFGATPVASSGSIFVNGPISAGSLKAAAGTSFTSGNIVSNGLISIAAGSTIGTGSITNTANTSLNAGTSINVGAINSGTGAVSLIAGTSFISGQTVAAGSIFADSGSDMTLNNLTAGGDIELVAAGDILIGNALAGESIDLDAGGTIVGGTMTAGDSVYAEAGESIDLLNISAGIVDPSSGYDADYNVGLLAGTTIDTGDIEAFHSIGLGAQGNIYTGSIDANEIFLALGGGDMSFGTIKADAVTYLADDSMIPLGGNPSDGDFNAAPILAATPVASGGSITLRGPVTTGRFVAAAGTTLIGTTIDSVSSIYTASGGNTTLTDLDAGSSIFQRSGAIITENDLDAGGSISLNGSTGIAAGDVSAGDFVLAIGGSITTGDIEAAQYITLASPGTITTGDINAGGIFTALGHGDMSFGDATASEVFLADYVMFVTGGGGGISGTCVGTCGTSGADGVVTAPPTGSSYWYVTTDGGVTGAGQIPGEGGTNGSIFTTAAFAAAAGDDLDFWFNYVTSDGSGFADYAWAGLFTTALSPVATLFTARTQPLGTIVPGQNLPGVEATLNPSSVPIVPGAPQWAPLGDSSGSCYDAGCGFTGWISSTYNIANAGNYVVRFGVTNWTDSAYQSGMAFSGITVGGVPVQPGLTRTGGSISIGNVETGKFTAAAGTSFTSGFINSGTSIDIGAGGNITAGTINAGSYIDIFSDTGLLDLDDLHAGTDIDLETEGSIQFGNVTADDLNFEAGGTVNGGNIVAVSHADGHAEGALTLKDVTVSGPPTFDDDDDDFSIGFTSATSITVENVDGYDRVGFATLGDLTTGNITAGSLFLTLVGGDVVTGSITTDAGGRVYMADASMCGDGCDGDDDNNNDESDVEVEDLLALAPVPTGGSITINGAVTTGLFQAAAGDNLATVAITADAIDASAGDNATINGAWLANDVFLASGDINITTNGRIDAGSAGEVTLNAVNDGGGAVIGDGVTGPGYALSNAEFGRISGGDITIIVGGNGGDADTLIGDLTITGPLAGSNIESNDGGVHFITLQEDGAAFDGTLRVAGDVVATGFGADNYLAFYTQNFELDAATGSIAITGSGGALAGTLELVASRIHVAEGSLLDRLADNPQFPGYREALNRPAAVQRPDGVIRAANFDIEFAGSDISGPYTLFVQNMGTTTVPAGFLLNAANIGDDGEGAAAGSIDMAINGQIIAEGGTLTGIAVRDLLVTEFGTSAFVAGSTINGCPLVGACVTAPPRVDTPTRTDVPLSDSSGLGDGLFGNEGDIDDGESGDGGDRSSPIAAPNPLFDSRPLSASDDVDDPVSGAGNPSLYGANPDEEGDVEVCDSTKDKNCKTNAKGDGK